MGEVNVDDLKKGMVLAKDLKDSRGRFLFERGSIIDEKHIRVMKIWGITAVDIEGMTREIIELDSLAAIDPKILEKARSSVDTMFCNSTEPHDALTELKRLCILQEVEKLSKANQSHPNINGSHKIDKHKKPPLITYADLAKEEKKSLNDLLEKNVQLSSFPDIYHQIVNILNDTRSSAVRIADVVSKDTSLSALLLKLINSAFYSIPTRVDSISRAVALIGGKELSTLAMGISVIRFFKDIPPELVDMKNFWLHSIACGVFARIMANLKIELAEEQFFISGLLHDIGRLVLLKELPLRSVYALRLSREKGIPLYRAEQEVFGYDHSEVAGSLLTMWNFSKNLVQMIHYHHSPLISKCPMECSIITVADIMTKALHMGNSGDPVIPSFEKDAWKAIRLSPSVLSHSVQQADRQVNEIFRIFNLHE